MRVTIIALLTSFLAGLFAAGTLKLMMVVTEVIWARDFALSPVYILSVATIGGFLIGLTRLRNRKIQTLADQIADATDPVQRKQSEVWMIALGATIAVGFGGALGPEAGLIAVVTELAALVSLLVARSAAEEREIGQASISAALGALYASPPGGAAYVSGEPDAAGWDDVKAASLPYLDFLAAIAGVAGFWLAAQFLFSVSFHRLHLPHHVNPWDGSDMVYAVLPGAMGAMLGAFFLRVRLFATQQVEVRLPHPVLQSTLGGFAFGLIAATLPIVLFSGHHEFETIIEWGAGAGVLALLGLAIAKVIATILCLSTGWRGGAIYPLMFAGASAGYAGHYIQDGPDVAVALAAGLAGATAAGLGRPIAALLILLFLVGTSTVIPLAVGVGLGLIAARFSPKPSSGH